MSSTAQEFERAAKKFQRYVREMQDEGREVYVVGIGNEILTDVRVTRMGRGVPRDTSQLAKSGRVEKTERGAIVSFGGAAAGYALIQHERTDFNHPNGGEPRYLVRGLERWRPNGSTARDAYADHLRDVGRILKERGA